MAVETDVFVIGTGPSGMTAARTAKTRRPDLAVTAVRREPSYVPCALPYALAGVIEVDSYVKNESKLMTGIGVKVLAGEVTRIVPDKKQVVLGRRNDILIRHTHCGHGRRAGCAAHSGDSGRERLRRSHPR